MALSPSLIPPSPQLGASLAVSQSSIIAGHPALSRYLTFPVWSLRRGAEARSLPSRASVRDVRSRRETHPSLILSHPSPIPLS